ncbi:hypothetical protein HNR19_002675 [Nocardioides thalensis]|uniref:Uncharacterized protein n=1 Tax=Nocardioides thalensis TaxID=1914755 RepID=A0A853C440_9ACTN|nr:hypothetical protein [Nocardioides thalensis]NYJ01977.1 hypothetical protein [Nocardioides thalensis]
MPIGSRARRGFSVLVLSSVLLAGCGDDGSDDAQAAFEDELEAMAGVDDAKVEREAFDTEYYGEEIVVDMASDATADEVTAVLDALRRRERASEGAPQDSKVTLGAGTTSRAGDDFAPDAAPGIFGSTRDHAANERMAELLLAAVTALPDHNVVVVSPTEWSVFGAAEGSDPRAALADDIDAIRSEPLLADSVQGDLSVTAGDRKASFGWYEGLTPDLLEAWHGVAAAFDHEAVRSVTFAGTAIWIITRLPEDVPPKQLTTQAYGDQLWPLVREQVEVLAGLDEHATLEITNEYAFDDDGYQEDRFVRLELGRDARPDRQGRTWIDEAKAYLDQVLATR